MFSELIGVPCELFMRAIFQSLLIIAVTFVYVAGPYVSVEMKHSHEMSEDHGHRHEGDDHSHRSHDEDSTPASGGMQGEESDGDSHSHKHVVSVGADSPFAPASHEQFEFCQSGSNHSAVLSEVAPDGPWIPLIKPPQVG